MQNAPRQGLAEWRRIERERDTAALGDLLHADAVFRSPVVHKSYEGAFALALAISTVMEVFEDFRYVGEYHGTDGQSVTLEFEARVGDRKLKGVDIIRFDGAGKIVSVEVMVRPRSGLEALQAEMAARIGDRMAAVRQS
jgi:hypothetical protein